MLTSVLPRGARPWLQLGTEHPSPLPRRVLLPTPTALHPPTPPHPLFCGLEHGSHVTFPPFSWTVPAPLAVRSWLLFSISALLQGQMHTNAFRSLQDKAWKGLPRHKNVSSPPAAGGGKEGALEQPPLSTPYIHHGVGDLWSCSLVLFGAGIRLAAVASSS